MRAQWRAITPDLQKLYQLYSGCPLGDQDKDWAPHVIRTSCSNGLGDWMNKRKTTMPCAIPMTWRQPKNHVDDCYFVVSVLLVSHQRINVNLCTKSNLCNEVNHSWWQFTSSRASREWTGVFRTNAMWRQFFTWSHSSLFRQSICPREKTSESKWFNQQELNDLMQDVSLPKGIARLLASRLKERNL